MSFGRELRGVIESAGERPEHRLRAIAVLREELDRAEAEQVRQALGEGTPWSRIGRALGVTRQAAHQKHAAAAQELERRVAVTPSARRAVRLARDEAGARGAAEVESGDLLLGLLRSDRSIARVLAARGVTADAVRSRLDGRGGETASEDGSPELSSEARGVLSEAIRDAVDRGHEELHPEHLLAAVLRTL